MQPFAPLLDLPAHVQVEARYRRDRPSRCPDLPLLVLVRGVPGSGKSTLARQLTALGYRHVEADDFFMVDGRYRYDASRIAQAHEWCREQTVSALRAGQRVVVANTFTRLRELAPYARLSDDVLVLWARGRWPNVHDVPNEVVDRMAARWEPLAAGSPSMWSHDATRDGSSLGSSGRAGPSRPRLANRASSTFPRGRALQAHDQNAGLRS